MTALVDNAYLATSRMEEFTMQNYIDSFLFNLQYNPQQYENIADKIIGQALKQLLTCGINPEDYKDFCNQVFEKANIWQEPQIAKKIIAHFHDFLLNQADPSLTNCILQEWGNDRDKLTDLVILQRSAAYIMRTMRCHSYKDDENTRYKSLAFTGPRPEKLPHNIDMQLLQQTILEEISKAIDNGFTYFYSGMSRGVDMLAAECVLKLKEAHPDIKLICDLPFGKDTKRQTHGWSMPDKERYYNILNIADRVDAPHAFLPYTGYFYRNRHMVNHSSLLLSVYDGISDGGTGFTVNYALKTGVARINIDPHMFLMP